MLLLNQIKIDILLTKLDDPIWGLIKFLRPQRFDFRSVNIMAKVQKFSRKTNRNYFATKRVDGVHRDKERLPRYADFEDLKKKKNFQLKLNLAKANSLI